MNENPFLSSSESEALKEPDLTRGILSVLPESSDILYELAFQASFAKKMSDIMAREGRGVQGYERMQQSFFEAVNKVKLLLEQVENDYRIAASEVLSLHPDAAKRLSQLIEDLALYKDWSIHSK